MPRKNKDRIDDLEAEIRDLRAEIESLRAQIAGLNLSLRPIAPPPPNPQWAPGPVREYPYWWQNPVISMTADEARSEALPSA